MLLLVHNLLVLGSRAGIRDRAHLLPSSIHRQERTYRPFEVFIDF